MTGPHQAGDSPTAAAHPAAATVLVAATCAALFVVPFAGSAGFRMAFLTIAGLTLVAMTRGRAFVDILRVPRAVLVTYALWAALAIASLAWSIDRRLTLGELKGELLYGALAFLVFFVTALRGAATWPRWWLSLMAGSLAVLAGLGLQEGLGVPLSRHAIEGGAGPWSTHLVMIAPLLFAIAWPRPWGFGQRPVVEVAAWMTLVIATWLTENRIAWAAFGVQIAIAIALTARAQPPESRGKGRRLLLGLALVAMVLAFGASIVERNARLFRQAPSVTTHLERDLRPMIWSVAYEQFRQSPWLGHGFAREILAPVFVPHTPPMKDHPAIRHAHNVFIDAALQLGAPGAVALVALFAALALAHARLLAARDTAVLGIMGLALVAGFVVKNLTDDFFYRHNAIVFWALNGLLLGLAQARSPAKG